MVRVKVLWAELDENDEPRQRGSYVTRIAMDGRITQTDSREARAILLGDDQAELVARYYRRHPKPGKIVYEEALSSVSDG